MIHNVRRSVRHNLLKGREVTLSFLGISTEWFFHVIILLESSLRPNRKAPLNPEIILNAYVGFLTTIVVLDLSGLLGAGIGGDEDGRSGVEVIGVNAVLLKDMASLMVGCNFNLTLF